ncbi:hypothetical protein HDV05_002696 [Chytridiales sp. JEL 0842]|nr:hypothetical protein HDV05_002696 [Chytridiales sp. JEL 0842]
MTFSSPTSSTSTPCGQCGSISGSTPITVSCCGNSFCSSCYHGSDMYLNTTRSSCPICKSSKVTVVNTAPQKRIGTFRPSPSTVILKKGLNRLKSKASMLGLGLKDEEGNYVKEEEEEEGKAGEKRSLRESKSVVFQWMDRTGAILKSRFSSVDLRQEVRSEGPSNCDSRLPTLAVPPLQPPPRAYHSTTFSTTCPKFSSSPAGSSSKSASSPLKPNKKRLPKPTPLSNSL